MSSARKADSGSGNIPSNILTLRRRLMMTQREFIDSYLHDDGKPILSLATLSNIERGGAANVRRVADKLAETMHVAHDIFELDPDSFAKNVDLFFGPQLARGEENIVERITEARRSSTVEKLVQTLSDYLMDAMVSGKLKTGDLLPSDRQLGAMLGVGRTPIREALKVLSILGLIQIFPGKGTFIASQSTDLFFAPLSWSFLLGQSTTRHIVDVRNVLEAEAARLAAAGDDQEAFAHLDAIFQQMTAAYQTSDFQSFLESDIAFHLAVAKCSANPIILNLLTTSRKLLAYISKSGLGAIGNIKHIYGEHKAIYAAIKSGNGDTAGNAMFRHLENAKERYNLPQNGQHPVGSQF